MPSILAELEKRRRRSLPPDAPLTEEEWNEACSKGETLVFVHKSSGNRFVHDMAGKHAFKINGATCWGNTQAMGHDFSANVGTWHRLPKPEQPKRVVHLPSGSYRETLCGKNHDDFGANEGSVAYAKYTCDEDLCPACARIAEEKSKGPVERIVGASLNAVRKSEQPEPARPEPEPWCVVSKEPVSAEDDPYTLQRETLFCEGAHMGIHVEARPVCKCGLPQSLTGKVLDVASGMMVNRRCSYCGEEV